MKLIKYIFTALFATMMFSSCNEEPVVPPLPDNGGGMGTQEAPFSVGQVIAMNNPGTTAWVKGYIVGVINYDNNSSLETSVPTTVASCIAIAASPDETNQDNCVAVQLPAGEIRSAINLKDNPQYLGMEVELKGSLNKYFGMPGLKDVSAYKIDGKSGGNLSDDNTPGTDIPSDGAGTKETPYSVEQVIALGNPGTEAWIEGIIVGVINYDNNSSLETTVPTTVNTCLAIASVPNETDKNKCVAVQLPDGDIRKALNLKDHPEYIGKQIKLKGILEKYFGIAGLKNTSAAVLDGQDVGSSSATPGSSVTMTKATEITSGGKYAFWTNDKVGQAMGAGKNYSWLTVSNAALNADGTLTTDAANAYTFTETANGWTINDSNGVYLYMEGTYNSFQLSTTLDEANATFFWSVTMNADGRVEIINKGNDKMMQFSSQYNSYGAYTDRTTGVAPYLYQSPQ